jgi:hypothetical protein
MGSLFVASYDSQGYGGGILTCLHTSAAMFCCIMPFGVPVLLYQIVVMEFPGLCLLAE